jgi:Holliday junction resolvase RusA-like endonuclease
MKDPIVITLEGQPTGKGRPRFSTIGGRPRAYTPAKTRATEDALRVLARAAMKGRPPISRAVLIHVTACFAIPPSWPKWKREAATDGRLHMTSRPDVENIAKLIDGIQGEVFIDDAQVVRMEVSKMYGPLPFTQIAVFELAGPTAQDAHDNFCYRENTDTDKNRDAPP